MGDRETPQKEASGVSRTQAEGGIGLLFRQATEKLNGADFPKLDASMSGVDKLISAARPALLQ